MGDIGSAIGGAFGGGSGLGGIASGLGSLFGGGGGGSSSGGGGSQAQAPSDAPVDTPGAVQPQDPSVLQDPVVQEQVSMADPQVPSGQDPAATIGGTQSGVQDPEITARQRQANMPPAPPQTQGLEALQSPQQLARLAAQALGQPGQNPWQLGPQGTNPLTQNLTNLAGQIPVQPGSVARAPTAITPVSVSPLPPPSPPPVTIGGRGGGGYGQISGAAQPDVASALRGQLQPPSPVTVAGRGGEPGYGQAPVTPGQPQAPAAPASPQATTALAPSPLAQTARQAQARKAAEASNFAGQDHDPSIPRSGSPGLDQVKSRLASIESAGGPNNGYGSVGQPVTNRRGVQGRGIGKYQVMSYNVGPWTERFLGQRMTPQQFLQNPHAQDRLATAVMKHLHRHYGNWQDVASVWRTGHPVSHHFPARRPAVTVSRPQMLGYPVQRHGRS